MGLREAPEHQRSARIRVKEKKNSQILQFFGARRIVFSGSETTGIDAATLRDITTGDWYDLNGRKLNGMPTKKGIYIQNGQKVVIK